MRRKLSHGYHAARSHVPAPVRHAWAVSWPTILLACLVVAVGFNEDRRSCQRQAPVRIALRDYAVAAASAREQSAAHEYRRNPWQAALDRQAAARFRQIASTVDPLDCSTIPPGK